MLQCLTEPLGSLFLYMLALLGQNPISFGLAQMLHLVHSSPNVYFLDLLLVQPTSMERFRRNRLGTFKDQASDHDDLSLKQTAVDRVFQHRVLLGDHLQLAFPGVQFPNHLQIDRAAHTSLLDCTPSPEITPDQLEHHCRRQQLSLLLPMPTRCPGQLQW